MANAQSNSEHETILREFVSGSQFQAYVDAQNKMRRDILDIRKAIEDNDQKDAPTNIWSTKVRRGKGKNAYSMEKTFFIEQAHPLERILAGPNMRLVIICFFLLLISAMHKDTAHYVINLVAAVIQRH